MLAAWYILKVTSGCRTHAILSGTILGDLVSAVDTLAAEMAHSFISPSAACEAMQEPLLLLNPSLTLLTCHVLRK